MKGPQEYSFDPMRKINPGPLRFCLAGIFESMATVAAHSHAFHELILVTKGSCWIDAGGKSSWLDTGDLIVIPSGKQHEQHSDESVQTCYIGGMWPAELLSSKLRIVDVRGDVFIRQWMQDLVVQHKHEHPPRPVVTYGLLVAVLGRLCRAEERTKHEGDCNLYYVGAVRFIEAHATEDLTVLQIAKNVGCSVSYLTSLFHEHLGCGLIAYQIRCRMNLACKHLIDPSFSVKQIAAACGWHDTNLFVRMFRQRMGLPPGKWRHQQDLALLDNEKSADS